MKRLLLIPLALFALVLSVTPAVAGQPEDAAGEWAYAPDVDGLTFRTAGNTTFIRGTEVSTFTGTFEGTSNDEFVVVCHQKGPETFTTSIRLTVEFTGEVAGRVGSFTMKASAKQDATVCAPVGAIWYGKWVIVGGTGQLADLHGNGDWTGPDNTFNVGYTGKIHFD